MNAPAAIQAKQFRLKNGVAMTWLLKNADKCDETCLLWPFTRTSSGYARVSTGKGRTRIASRFICELYNGPPPSPKHEAAHNCGNGSLGCVNPKHIAWKTKLDNIRDTTAHGKTPKGERNGGNKLTERQAREILSIRGLSQVAIAQKYGVSKSAIGYIQLRKKWKHL